MPDETPKQREEKAKTLALATEVLSSRVQSLTDVVTTNNKKIDLLQKEVNKKPDDAEVQAIAGFSSVEHKQLLFWAIGIGLVSAIISSSISYAVADGNRQGNCKDANNRIDAAVEYYNGAINEEMTNKFIDDTLRKSRVMRNRNYIKELNTYRPEC